MLELNVQETIMLGTSTNLTMGFNPEWEPGNNEKTALFETPCKPLEEKDIVIPDDEDCYWTYPQISLHDNAEDLLSAVFPFEIINPSDGTEKMEIKSGALLIGDSDRDKAIASLSKTLGIDISNESYGYAFVKIERISGPSNHPVCQNGVILHPNPLHKNEKIGINKNFRSDLVKIRKATDEKNKFNPNLFTGSKAQKCLDLYNTYGTHFVSEVICGDAIFQVFAYSSEKYKKVKHIYELNDFTEEGSLNFLKYITDANTGVYGYVSEYGKVLSYSGDKQLENDISLGLWMDEKWSGKNCVFSPFIAYYKINIVTLNTYYTKNISLYYKLTSLSIFAEYQRRLALKRVFKGAMIQKYKSAVTPYFEKYFPYDIDSLPSYNDIPGFISTIPTRDVNTYKPNLNFNDLQFVAADETLSFTLCSNLISATSADHAFPGKDFMLAFQNADFENDKYVTTITLEDEAYDSYNLSCKDFYGCLQIASQNQNEHETILDGIVYSCGDCNELGRSIVVIKDDLRNKYDSDNLTRIKSSIIYAYTFADSVLSGCSYENLSDSSCKFALESMEWISEIIPENCDDIELMDIRVSALDAIRAIENTTYGSYVPILSPDKYEKQCQTILDYLDEIQKQMDYYQQQIDLRKTQELIIDVGETLNENIIESGQLLSDFIQANAQQQQELINYYDSIIAEKQIELNTVYNNVDALESEVNVQRTNVINAVDQYKSDVEEWKTKTEIKFGLDMATTLFSTITSILIPASSIVAVKDLGLSVQRIQKLLNILNNVYKVYSLTETSMSNLKSAENALEDVDDCCFDVYSSVAWDELSINLNYIMDCGPDVGAKKLVLKEFSLLVLKGKSLMSALTSSVTLSKDIYNQQRQKVLCQNQQERLNKLAEELEPKNLPSLDPLSIDLVGLTGDLMFLQTQMYATLAKTFLMYDQALRYCNLQPATVISSFDLLSFKGAIVHQQQNTITAQTKLAAVQISTTNDIEIKVKVPVTKLINGNIYTLNIMLDNPSFLEYVDVKVKSVVARIDGISSTDSNKYLVRLNYPGSFFNDRDLDRNPISFRTDARARIYEYNAKTNQPNFTDKGESWSDDVSAITPFSAWEISLPSTNLNKGIKFKDVLAEVTLSFVLDARIVDKEKYMLLGATEDLPDMNALIGKMSGKTALNGWDVVFNMTLDKIQNILDEQYDELKKNSEYGGKIDVTTEVPVTLSVTAYKKFLLEYSYPKLSFLPNDCTNVELEIPIQSGSVQSGSSINGGEVIWDPPVEVNPDAYISAHVPLGKATGLVEGSSDSDNVLSVILDFAEGSFKSDNMDVEGDDNKAAFNKALINYFMAHKVQFIINSLDMSQISVLPDMRPNEFLFKTLITELKSQILQLFIMTGDRKAKSASLTFLNSVTEPIPIGQECSLMLSSELFFNKVMPQSLNQSGWHMVGVDPDDDLKAWSGKFDQGTLNASVDLSELNHTSVIPSGYASTTYTYTYYVPGNTVTTDINGMSLSPNDRQIKLYFSEKQTQQFIEKCVTETVAPFYHDEHEDTRTLESDYNIEINAKIPLSISGDGRDQEISLKMKNQDCSISGHLSGGGPCGCGDDLQAEFNQQLNAQLPSEISSKMNVNFNDISLFALKNLLFINDDYITFKDVAVPGDILIVGKFNK